MANFKVQAIIEKPVEELFNFVSNPENNPQWQDIKTASVTQKFKNGEVKTFQETQSFRGTEATSEGRVTKNKKNEKFEYYSKLASYKLTMKYKFVAKDDTTEVFVEGNVSSRGLFGKSIWFHLFSPAMMQRQVNKNLASLKGVLEG